MKYALAMNDKNRLASMNVDWGQIKDLYERFGPAIVTLIEDYQASGLTVQLVLKVAKWVLENVDWFKSPTVGHKLTLSMFGASATVLPVIVPGEQVASESDIKEAAGQSAIFALLMQLLKPLLLSFKDKIAGLITGKINELIDQFLNK